VSFDFKESVPPNRLKMKRTNGIIRKQICLGREAVMDFRLIFSTAFLLGGLACVIAGLVQRKRARDAASWPTVQGQVIESGLQEHRTYDSESGASINFLPVVQFRYTLLGQVYSGDHISFGNVYYDKRTAMKKIAPYTAGSLVTIHYDPDNPANAVLEIKAIGSNLLLILGGAFMFLGILAVIFLPEL
jgi:hypothetical protein